MSSPARRPTRPRHARRRPLLVVEAMERRELMAARVHPAVAAKAQPPILMAALGDSLTDEYTFQNQDTLATQSVNRGTARNWVSTLMALRMGQLSFGEYSTVNRGGSRQQGFSQDWALSGEPAVGTDVGGLNTTFINQYAGSPGISPGMLTQSPNATGDVDPKSIKVVTIYIGTNDYNLGLTAYATSNGQVDVFDTKPGTTNVVNARVEDAITAAVGKIRTTNPGAKVVVVTPQEVTATPLLLSKFGAVPGLFPKVSGSLATLNADLARIAKKQKFGFVNLQAMQQQMGAAPTVAGQAINTQGAGPDLADEYVADGFHFGTLMSGKIAQAVVKQVDTLYGKNVVTPISDSDILQYARAIQTGVAVTRAPSPTDPSRSTLTAGVTSGVGNGSAPTGSVTFEAVATPTAANPTPAGTVLGSVPVDAKGRATLDVANSVVDTSSIYAIYSGDELHVSHISNALAPFAVTT